MGMLRVFVFFICIFAGFWTATQSLAEKVHYDALLGAPSMVSEGVPYYFPWRYIGWWVKFHNVIPNLFQQTYVWIFAGFLFGFVLVFLTMKKKTSTNYGSARWAEYDDLLKMEVISAHGVVIGLYDAPWKRGFTKIYRWLETLQNTKVKYAELDFENRQAKKRDKMLDKLAEIENKMDASVGRELQELRKEKQQLMDVLGKPAKYDPKSNPVTVFPFVWFYKKVGKLYNAMSHFYLRDNSNKHMAVIAPTRSGKGVGLIIPTLLGSWNASCIVNDIKRENWEVTAGYRKRMGQVCIKFEPTKSDGTTARWNPMDEIPVGTSNELMMAQNIAHTLADYEGKGKLDHWGSNAEVVILTVMLHMSYAYYADRENYPMKPNLSTLANFLKANMIEEEKKDDAGNVVMDENNQPILVVRPKGFIESLQVMMGFAHVPDKGIKIERWDSKRKCMVAGKYDETRKMMVEEPFTPNDLHRIYYMYKDIIRVAPNTHPLVYKNFMEIVAKPEGECGSIISTANTALKEYLDPVLATNTSVSDFCIDDIMNYDKPVSLYLVTPPSDLLRLSPIFRLFFEMMIQHHAADMGFKNARPVDLYKHKCLLLMDEFSSLGNLATFASTMSYIAGYGLKVFLIIQGKPQMDKIYGKDNDIFLNCHMQIFYGPNETETARYAADQLGDQTIVAEDPFQGFFSKQQRTKKEMARKLMTMDELKQLGDKEIILASGNPPLLTWKVKYYEDKYFTSKLVPAPVVSDIIRMKNGEPYYPYGAWVDRVIEARKANKKTPMPEMFNVELNWDVADKPGSPKHFETDKPDFSSVQAPDFESIKGMVSEHLENLNKSSGSKWS
jgi:type IV secretion system protein VirD4